MKRYSLIICLVLILSLPGVASAQVVLPPQDVGGIAHVIVHTFNPPTGTTFSFTTSYRPGATVPIEPLVGHTTYDTTTTTTIVNVQAAFEFNLGPVIPPTFTSQNFTAKLDGLNVTYSYAYYITGTMNVDLFDMGDANEDGDVYYDDYNMTRGSRIARRTHTFFDPGPPSVPAVPADFNNIDVTDALRRDLFDLGGSNEDYSGFILKSPDAQSELVWYDPATPTITITPGVSPIDLAVSKTVSDTTPDEGQTITYTITLTNNGPNPATTVSIIDQLPAGVTYSSDDGGGSYISGTGVWTVGTINNGASVTLNIQATVDAGTAGSTITNSITSVSLDQTDNNTTPDDLNEAIMVNGTDLAVSKTVNDTTPNEGQTITYTITLTNNGPNPATTVSIIDQLPADVTYSGDNGGGSYISGTGVWTVGTINNSASATLNIQATVDAGTAGSTITNSITSVSLDQTDSNATPDDLNEAITVNAGGGGGGGGGCFIVNASH